MRKVADTIRHFRKQKGLKQEELAKATGMNYRHLQRIEAGEVDLRISTIDAISGALQIPLCQLLTPVDQRERNTLMGCAANVLEFLPAGLEVVDLEGAYVYVNRKRAEMLGLSPAQMCRELKLWDVHANDQEKTRSREFFANVLRARPAPTPFHAVNRHTNGNAFNVRFDWDYITGAKGDVRGFVSLVSKV